MGMSQEKGTFKELRLGISSAKNDLLGPDEIKNDPLLQKTYRSYQEKLKECNALDFDDLLYLTVKLLKEDTKAKEEYQNRWLFILIDEYQDTNFAQYTLAKLLVAKHQNIFAVGDPDQSIYSWRGARYQNILNFESDFPGATIVTLDQNYRSTNRILQAANALIEQNSERYEKKLWSDLGEGDKAVLFHGQNEKQEAVFVSSKIQEHLKRSAITYDDVAIFYRTNAQSRTFEDTLLSHKIPYSIIGGLSFYDRREVKDILALLRLVVSNSDLVSFLRTINIPRRGLGPAVIEKLVDLSSQKNLPILTLCQEVLSSSEFKLNQKQREGLRAYIRTIHELREQRTHLKIYELISEAIAASKYMTFLQEDPETFQDRKENLDELIGKAAEWEEEKEDATLIGFLEELSLRTPIEQNAHVPTIKLMTLHNSKGLEFPLVFLVGLEEDLLPHINSKENPSSLEEERRLCYVGMTRAKRHLYLCHSLYRYMWGTPRLMRPSRFLKEIPSHLLQPLSLQSEPITEEIEFSLGDRVYHKEFGAGIVQKVSQTSLGLTYEVYFPEAETIRTLAAKYAKLRPA